ncbi:transposase [bacterium]|nr:transposase [bacterium]
MEEQWINTNDLALIKGISTRAIRKSISRNKYVARKVGRQYEILVSSLEKDVQCNIENKYFTSSVINNTIVISEKTKLFALQKFDLVMNWRNFATNYKGTKAESVKDFIICYSVQHGDKFNTKFNNLGIATMFRWNKILKENNDDWHALVPKYICSSRGTTQLSEREQTIFLKLLLQPNKTNIGKAIKLTKQILFEQGYNSFACDMTYRRFADKYKKQHYDIWVLSREDEKALKDKVIPYIERDISKLNVGDVIIGDGHKLAFQIINPFDGKACRPTLVAYQDWKSGALVGFEIMLEENTQCIASALRNSIMNLGKIPKYIYQDNGKAFRSKYFTESSYVNGLFVKLGITPIFAKPYNAKAKPIERLFREMQDGIERLLPSFVGANVYDKPAYLKRNEKLHKNNHNNYIPTIEEAVEIINKWINFHYAQECPHVKNKSIGEILDSGKGNGIDLSQLDDLMMVSEIKRIGRNGIRFLKSDYYHECLYGIRTNVVIKYSLFDLSNVKVYSTDGKFLCIATKLKPINPLANYIGDAKDIEEFKQRTKQQKRLEKQTVNAYLTELNGNQILPLDITVPDYDAYQSLEDKYPTTFETSLDSNNENPTVFLNNFERYEYIKNKEEIYEDEARWSKNFEKSEEYKLIYE